MQSTLSKATLGRLPMYLQFIRRMDAEKVSATQIAKGLGLGEVQVRKDLASVYTAGLPKVGYPVSILRRDMEKALGVDVSMPAVIVGAGKLGTALMDYDGFSDYGVEIAAAFDRSASAPSLHGHVPVYPMDQLAAFCTSHHIQTGILTVPASAAQKQPVPFPQTGSSKVTGSPESAYGDRDKATLIIIRRKGTEVFPLYFRTSGRSSSR